MIMYKHIFNHSSGYDSMNGLSIFSGIPAIFTIAKIEIRHFLS
jgi:hypothetical protein